MQPIKTLSNWLEDNASKDHYIFTLNDMRPLLPSLSDGAFKALLSRSAEAGVIHRVCRGIYIYPKAIPNDGLLLFHVAQYLRSSDFNYISLETSLSDEGIISQVPINRITIMSSGRSNIISCSKFGTIEFVHTTRRPKDIMDQLIYDNRCGMWRAKPKLALEDMKHTKRNIDLIDMELANELI